MPRGAAAAGGRGAWGTPRAQTDQTRRWTVAPARGTRWTCPDKPKHRGWTRGHSLASVRSGGRLLRPQSQAVDIGGATSVFNAKPPSNPRGRGAMHKALPQRGTSQGSENRGWPTCILVIDCSPTAAGLNAGHSREDMRSNRSPGRSEACSFRA